MYRRQRSFSPLLLVIALGLIAGVAFIALRQSRAPSAEPLPTATAAPPTRTPRPTLEPLPTGTPSPRASVVIPAAGVNVPVVEVYLDGESWDVSQLGNNAGHLQGTSWFGTGGNVVLAGHVELPDGRPGIFAEIDALQQGDPLILRLGDREQHYAVAAVRKVAPDDLSVVDPNSGDRLTLITCDSYDFLMNDYRDRLVVVAERVG